MTKIEWTDVTWNPTTGCTRVSAGCDHCYAVPMTRRLAGMGKKYQGLVGKGHFNGVVKCHEDALDIPLHWRKPRMVFVNSMSDLFHPDVPFDFIDKVFDVIWQCPQHTFQVLTKRGDRLVEYVRERSYRRAHGWVDQERVPLCPGDFIHMDDIVMRNQCGYVGEGDWQCDHPKNDECGKEESCDAFGCPIAQRADDRESLTKIGVAEEYEFDAEGFADDSDWMKLYDRPLHAAPGNLWLGFSAEDQQTYGQRARAFQELRWVLGPHFTLFASLEPLLGPIDFKIPTWPDDPDNDGEWSVLDQIEWNGACEPRSTPYLNWVICGCESKGARAGRFADEYPKAASSIIDQCRAAGVPAFHKQMPINGRVSHDMSEWPKPMRVRDWPAVATAEVV